MTEAGMPAIETIQAATITNTMLLGISNEIGQIKANFIADIIAVDDSQLTNIKTLEKTVFVMKDGKIYKK